MADETNDSSTNKISFKYDTDQQLYLYDNYDEEFTSGSLSENEIRKFFEQVNLICKQTMTKKLSCCSRFIFCNFFFSLIVMTAGIPLSIYLLEEELYQYTIPGCLGYFLLSVIIFLIVMPSTLSEQKEQSQRVLQQIEKYINKKNVEFVKKGFVFSIPISFPSMIVLQPVDQSRVMRKSQNIELLPQKGNAENNYSVFIKTPESFQNSHKNGNSLPPTYKGNFL